MGLALITPAPFDGAGFVDVDPAQPHAAGGNATIAFDPNTGAISHLNGGRGGADWATTNNPIAHLWYHGMDEKYFSDFTRSYNVKPAENFGKPGDLLPSISSNPTLNKLQRKETADTVSFLLSMAIDSAE